MATMKSLTQIAATNAIALALIGIVGCGGGSGSAQNQNPEASAEPRAESMELGTEYSVQPNDRVVVTSSDPARLRVVHDSDADARRVTLLSGSAELHRE